MKIQCKLFYKLWLCYGGWKDCIFILFKTKNVAALCLEKLLDENLKGPVLSTAQMLLAERCREKEMLLNQNGELRRENALLRSALASSTVLAGLRELTVAKVPVS